MQVYEQTCDELSRTLRPNNHHECWHPRILSKRRLVQTGFLPPVILLLSLRVHFYVLMILCKFQMLKEYKNRTIQYVDTANNTKHFMICHLFLTEWSMFWWVPKLDCEGKGPACTVDDQTLIIVLEHWTCWRPPFSNTRRHFKRQTLNPHPYTHTHSHFGNI